MGADRTTEKREVTIYKYAEPVILNYELHKSNRKSISIIADPIRGIIVKAPLFCDNEMIEGYLAQKQLWIIGKIENFSNYDTKPTVIDTARDDNVVKLLGKTYELVIQNSASRGHHITINGDRIVLRGSCANPSLLERWLIDWYKDMALNFFRERTKKLQMLTGTKANDVKIRTYRSRWGTCTYRSLTINWKLIMAPVHIIDAVILHELCHIQHPNHSSSFWDKLRAVNPEYLLHNEWLKYRGSSLNIIVI